MMYHKSVLLSESIEALAVRSDGTYVDATFGGGGHSREILRRLTTGRLFAFDQDAQAMENIIEDPLLTTIHSNFRHIRNFLRLYNVIPVDGILADLGISSHQIDQGERGFSIRFDGPLDMRMDRRQTLTARSVVNDYPEEKLRTLFLEFGEIIHPEKVASLIAASRKKSPIATTSELAGILRPLASRNREYKFLAQVFQAMRIEVNQELDALKELLVQSTDVLRQGGRLVVISYHSLEDSLVKHFFRAGNWSGEVGKDFYGNVVAPFSVITRKAVVAGKQEIEENPRARSARLRAARKN